MSASSSPSSPRSGAFTVTVSGDPRFIGTIRTLTHRAAEADGCTGADAARLADAVERVLSTLLGEGPGPVEAGTTDLQFEPSADAFSVEIRVRAQEVEHRGGTLERSLEAHGDLDTVRRLVPDAEFGSAGKHDFCRMACLHAGSS